MKTEPAVIKTAEMKRNIMKRWKHREEDGGGRDSCTLISLLHFLLHLTDSSQVGCLAAEKLSGYRNLQLCGGF